MRFRELATGEVRWARIKATAVHDPDGGVRLAINVIEDITELKRSEESQRFLAEASRRLSGSSLDYERTLAAVTELAVPALADRCEVRLVEDELAPEALEVVRTGAAWLEPSRMIVPMTARARDRHGRARGRRTRVRHARTCSSRRTSGCARARRSRTRGCTARRRGSRARCRPRCCRRAAGRARAPSWRRRSIPPGRDSRSAATSTTSSRPATGQWYLVIGDVSGKGAEAAAVTALARYTLRTAAARRRSPAAILRWVDEAMVDQDAARGRYCTIACAHVDLARSPARLTVACGGHPLPVLRRADGEVEQVGAYGHAARAGDATRRCTIARPTCIRATRWCSTRTG